MVVPNNNVRGLSAVANAFIDRGVCVPGGRGFSAVRIGSAVDCDGDPVLDRSLVSDGSSILEPLEARQMMSVSMNDAGFTVVTPAADSRIVYVSSSDGSDSNTGLSASRPVKTLAKAISLVRNDSADQLLLKRGDSWNENFGRWTKSGRSESEPLLISAYGLGDRPLIKAGKNDGMVVGSASARDVSHVTISGLHFWANGRDPSVKGYDRNAITYGIAIGAGGSDFLIEDVKIEKFMSNISLGSPNGQLTDVTVRRSIITDAYDVGNSVLHAQGLYADGVRNLTLEQNTFDHNGWLESVPGAKATVYNHNVYVTGRSSGLIAKGNIFANAASHGMQARSGGIIKGNLFLNNPIGLSYGLVNGAGVTVKGGVSGDVALNVFAGGRDIDGSARGVGIQMANIRANSGTTIRENIFTSYDEGGLPALLLEIGRGVTEKDAVGLNDLTIRDNVIHEWGRGISVSAELSPYGYGNKKLDNVVLKNNRMTEITKTLVTNGRYLSTDTTSKIETSASVFPAPDRNLAGYNKKLGGYNAEWQFLATARDRQAGMWDTDYAAVGAVNYIRGGFGMYAMNVGPGTVPPVVPPVIPPVVVPPVVPPVIPPVVPPVVVPPVVPPTVPEPEPAPDPTPVVGGNGNHGVPRKDAAVSVRSLKFNNGKNVQKLTVKFTKDLGDTVDLNDLSLVSAEGQAINNSGMTLIWKARKHKAVWKIDADQTTKLASGTYTATIYAAGVTDANGRQLDGNKDRVGGDNYSATVKVKK